MLTIYVHKLYVELFSNHSIGISYYKIPRIFKLINLQNWELQIFHFFFKLIGWKQFISEKFVYSLSSKI